MLVAVKYLFRDPKTGILAYRRAYPPKLRPFIPSQPQQLYVSLGVRTMNVEAQQTFDQANAQFERMAALARKAEAGAFDRLDEEAIKFLSAAWLTHCLEEDEIERWQPMDGPAGDDPAHKRGWREKRKAEALETIGLVEAELKDALGLGDEDALIDLLGFEAQDFAESQGYRIDASSPEFAQLCQRMAEAQLAALDAQRRRWSGETMPTPGEPTRPAKPRQEKVQSFANLAETIMASPRFGAGQATLESTRTALRYFRETHGDIPALAITRQHVSQWLDLLTERPSQVPHKERSLRLPELVERYRGKDVPRMKGKTQSQNLAALAAIWAKGQKQGLIPFEAPNPFTKHDIKVENRPEDGRQLSLDEVQAIFSLPIFAKGERPARGRGEASYWLPLLIYCTGARPEEIAQLLVADFWQEGEQWRMRITDEGDHPVKGKRSLKTERHNAGRREFPVPAMLIELGLPSYLQWLKDNEENVLFPQLTIKNARGQLYPSFGDWWSPYLKEKGIVPNDRERRPMREMRQNWTTAARACGLPMEAIEYIQGHTTAGKSAHVGYGSRKPLGEWMSKMHVQGLGAVHRWEPKR